MYPSYMGITPTELVAALNPTVSVPGALAAWLRAVSVDKAAKRAAEHSAAAYFVHMRVAHRTTSERKGKSDDLPANRIR